MSFSNSFEIARRCTGDTALRHVRTETSAVTTAWGVNWSEALIARDLMQNFYDANRAGGANIQVAVEGRDVTISAPAAHNLERLFYLGSEKGPDEVGHYGEGFKVAVTCLLRDHRVTPVALSGSQALCLRISDDPVAGTKLYPLIYDFFETTNECAGTRLILPDCSPKLVQALQAGLTHFFYPANPLLGAQLWVAPSGLFLIYASADQDGHVFYRNLLRGDIARLPLVLVIHKEYRIIEDKIKNDRDRNAFGDKLMDTFYKTFIRHGIDWERNAMRVVVEAGRACWEQGHPLLSALADSTGYHVSTLFDTATAQALFQDQHYARSHSNQPALQLRYAQVEAQWQQEGRIGLPGYFVKFGVPSAERYIKERDEKARLEASKTNSRSPTQAEEASMQVLNRVLGQLAAPIQAVFSRHHTRYTVARTDAVLGELKKGRGYRSQEVFLAEQVFEADFAEALAIYLHEHAHIFGHDGDRGFTDALTELIENVVRLRRELDGYEAQWETARKKVIKERNTQSREASTTSLQERLAVMSEGEVRSLLNQVPGAVMERLLRPR